MSNMLSTGASGLLAFQSALTTISHNISNASTPGYNRQSVSFVANPADPSSNGWVGNGVSVSGVSRAYNNFLYTQTLSTSSGYNQLSTFSGLASSIDTLLGDPTSGLSAGLQQFSQALQSLSTSPSQTTSRQAVLTQAQTLITQMQGYDGALSQLDTQVSGQMTTEVAAVSSIAQSIATLNQQIKTAAAQSTQSPNDLLDQRDQLLTELSQHIGVTSVTQTDGTLSIFAGNGQPLVIGGTAASLSAGMDPFNSGQPHVFLQGANGAVDITSSLSGGSIGGLLQFQQQMLTPAHNALGQAALTVATLVNAQNAAGLDQNGQPGGALLTVGSPRAMGAMSNTGTETVTAALTASVTGNTTDLGGLTTSDYYLSYDGSQWSMTDTQSGVATPLTASGSGPVTLTGAGLTLTVSGAAQKGDFFLVQPTRLAISGLGLTTRDPSRIAAAAPLVTGAAASNTGTGSIDAGQVSSMAAWTRGNYTLAFTSPSTYTITGSNGQTTSGNYVSGQAISFNGMSVTISGAPATGDQFTINDNSAGKGDGRNALKIAAFLTNPVLAGGTQSLAGAYGAFVGTVGLQTSQAQNGAAAQQSAMTSAQAAQQSVSGVNLDEEAANLLRFQQAYQAAAQIIKVSDSLFQTLIQSI
jgi:flagellar hook-associated protein 1 FlgK